MTTQNGANDEGYFYMPYVKMSSPVVNINDFSISKSLIANYAKKIVNPEFFGTVTLDNLGPTTPKLVQGWLFDDNEAC